MKKSFKAALCTILAVCLVAAVLAGCAQAGEERGQDLNGLNDDMNYGTRNQGYNRNNLVGGRYRNNLTGNNMAGNTGNNGNNMAGNTGNNGRNGMTGTNMTGNRTGMNTGTTRNYTGNTNGSIIGYNGTGRNNNGTNGFNGTNGNGTSIRNSGVDWQRAKEIERQLENTVGVDCSVLVNTDTALVGVRNNGTNRTDISRLRTSIERKVKQIDSTIKNVKITDSPDMLTRMGRLGTNVTDDFMDEFNKLINSLGGNGTAR